jgi:hypothetical protein
VRQSLSPPASAHFCVPSMGSMATRRPKRLSKLRRTSLSGRVNFGVPNGRSSILRAACGQSLPLWPAGAGILESPSRARSRTRRTLSCCSFRSSRLRQLMQIAALSSPSFGFPTSTLVCAAASPPPKITSTLAATNSAASEDSELAIQLRRTASKASAAMCGRVPLAKPRRAQ